MILFYRKYTAGELRAWHRGHRARRLGKPYRCNSKNANYVAAWRDGWFAAERELPPAPTRTGEQK